MKIQTLSVVVGTKACNARCPFCVGKMTPPDGLVPTTSKIHWRNLDKAVEVCKRGGVLTVLLTSKGEPTLYPDLITVYAQKLAPHFPFIELQTNGLRLEHMKETLSLWYEIGMTTICLSVVSHRNEDNQRIYPPPDKMYPDLGATIDMIHEIGMSVRLSVIAMSPFMYQVRDLAELLKFAETFKVEQVTVRPVSMPDHSEDPSIVNWIAKHQLRDTAWEKMTSFIQERGTQLMSLAHGGAVFDVDGQNICLATCLTIDPEEEELRQLIFFPDGHLRYDWQYKGAILI
jgi:molybdenum cofactor biosynthesis enzyme MoaA